MHIVGSRIFRKCLNVYVFFYLAWNRRMVNISLIIVLQHNVPLQPFISFSKFKITNSRRKDVYVVDLIAYIYLSKQKVTLQPYICILFFLCCSGPKLNVTPIASETSTRPYWTNKPFISFGHRIWQENNVYWQWCSEIHDPDRLGSNSATVGHLKPLFG